MLLPSGPLAKQARWYHWAGALAFTGGVQVVGLVSMGGCYKWYYADDERRDRLFLEKYGLPTEAVRLALFAKAAKDWDTTIALVEKPSADNHRRELFQQARGDVLEVATGTCQVMDVLEATGEVISYVGVDCVQEMIDVAKPKMASVTFPADVQCADAHRLPFADDSFDTVMGGLCLCSVERPAEALAEMARVCRPSGHILLVEPGLASNYVVRASQRHLGLVPQLKHAWDSGWYDDREPLLLVEQHGGLEVVNAWTRAMGNWHLIVAKPRVAQGAIVAASGAVPASAVVAQE